MNDNSSIFSAQEDEALWGLRKPNWNEWESVKQVKVWEAIALALDIDPINFYFFRERKLDTLFSRQPPHFVSLLQQAIQNISGGGILKPISIDHESPAEREVTITNFVKWAKSIRLELPPRFPGISVRGSVAKNNKPAGENDRSTLLTLIATLVEETKLDIAHPSKTALAIEDCTVRLGARVSARAIENHLKRIGTVVSKPLESRESHSQTRQVNGTRPPILRPDAVHVTPSSAGIQDARPFYLSRHHLAHASPAAAKVRLRQRTPGQTTPATAPRSPWQACRGTARKQCLDAP